MEKRDERDVTASKIGVFFVCSTGCAHRRRQLRREHLRRVERCNTVFLRWHAPLRILRRLGAVVGSPKPSERR